MKRETGHLHAGSRRHFGTADGADSQVCSSLLTRRGLLMALGAGMLTAARVGSGQDPRKIPQVGYVGNSTPGLEAALVDAFRQGLRERGYVEGKNIVVHYVWAQGRIDVMPKLVSELIGRKVDVLLTSGTPATQAAKKATTTLPIVMAAVGDAVGVGIVPSLARPGGNITGLSTLYNQLEGKRIELLRELAPRTKRIALLANPANAFTPLILKSTLAAAKALQIDAQVHEVSAVEEFDRAFAAIVKTKPDAMAVLADRPFLVSNRSRIVPFAARERLPTIYPFSEFVEEGGLVFYGPSFADMFRRSATYVDKILKGAKPADLPIEQPTKFELFINQKTAQALGIKIPQSVLLRADRVIE